MGNKPTVLLILDGFGVAKDKEVSAIEGYSPYIKELMEEYPWAEGSASGFDVGLPEGQMGNSEVGHLNIGAGRVVDQPLVKITKQIMDGAFFDNKTLIRAIDNCKDKDTNLHIYGLLSDGGVHSHINHLFALLELAKKQNFDRVYVHAFLDGRDTQPKSGKHYLEQLEEKMKEIGVGKIASISGRYYAMDRDNRWDRIKLAYQTLTLANGKRANSAISAIEESYLNGVTDEFVEPTAICEGEKPISVISDNDSIIFFNFRPDRARQITSAFCNEDFNGFDREKVLEGINYVCFSECDTNILNKKVAFPQEDVIVNNLSEYLSKNGLKQLHIAETEKYAHVTFFFNGGIEKEYPGEDRILVPSPKVATYDLKPEMSVYEVTEKLIEALEEDEYDFIVCNFANCDMVGHTGIMDATRKAVAAVDECTRNIVEKVIKLDGQMFICADHGNCEEMLTKDGNPQTSHTTNKVPFILINYRRDVKLREGGKLGDVAPTLLEMMGLDMPQEMTGESLLVEYI